MKLKTLIFLLILSTLRIKIYALLSEAFDIRTNHTA